MADASSSCPCLKLKSKSTLFLGEDAQWSREANRRMGWQFHNAYSWWNGDIIQIYRLLYSPSEGICKFEYTIYLMHHPSLWWITKAYIF